MSRKIQAIIFVTLTILVAIVFAAFPLPTAFINFNVSAATQTAEFYFEPENATVPPATTLRLILNPKSQEISFVRATVYFDPDLVRLISDISVNSTQFAAVFPPTNPSTANSTGEIEIALYQKTDMSAPSKPFQVASFTFDYSNANNAGTTDITLIDEDSQIVNSNFEIVPFTVKYANFNVSPSSKEAGLLKANAFSAQGACGDGYIDTAIGCIPYKDNQAMAEFFLSWGMGIGGGIALVLIAFSGYQITTTSGDPKKLQAGKELLTAATTGLILLAFAAFVLRVIGVDILGIF